MLRRCIALVNDVLDIGGNAMQGAVAGRRCARKRRPAIWVRVQQLPQVPMAHRPDIGREAPITPVTWTHARPAENCCCKSEKAMQGLLLKVPT